VVQSITSLPVVGPRVGQELQPAEEQQ
jgi:hypothetical protein